jgi:polyhydroxybutyrate depolymerase
VIRRLGATAALLAAMAPAAAASTGGAGLCPAPGGDARELHLTVSVDGVRRQALVHLPPQLGSRPLPVLLALHGYRGSGPQMERYSGFDHLADRSGFIVAYPGSSGTFWNSDADPRLPDDVHFLSVLIDRLDQRLCPTPGRVYLVGVSNGGGMAALAACRLQNKVNALASVAGGYDGQPACHRRSPLPVLEIHGTADPVVPYFGHGHGRPADGLPPFVAGWVRRDRCPSPPRIDRPFRRTVRLRWRGCAGGSVVEHIRVLGGRHQWPGARPPDPGPRATFCASCVIWDFLASLPSSRS